MLQILKHQTRQERLHFSVGWGVANEADLMYMPDVEGDTGRARALGIGRDMDRLIDLLNAGVSMAI